MKRVLIISALALTALLVGCGDVNTDSENTSNEKHLASEDVKVKSEKVTSKTKNSEEESKLKPYDLVNGVPVYVYKELEVNDGLMSESLELINLNIQALQEENKDLYLSTLTKEYADNPQVSEWLDSIFKDFDITYTIEKVDVEVLTDSESVVYVQHMNFASSSTVDISYADTILVSKFKMIKVEGNYFISEVTIESDTPFAKKEDIGLTVVEDTESKDTN